MCSQISKVSPRNFEAAPIPGIRRLFFPLPWRSLRSFGDSYALVVGPEVFTGEFLYGYLDDIILPCFC